MTFSQTVALQKRWKGYYTDPECLKQPLKIRKVNGIDNDFVYGQQYNCCMHCKK